MSFTVEFSEEQEVAAVILDGSTSQWDVPIRLEFYASEDGVNWEGIEVSVKEGYTYFFKNPVACRMIRMEIGELDEVASYNWSIDELSVLHPVQ